MNFSQLLRIGAGVWLGLVLLSACESKVRGTQERTPEGGDDLGGGDGDLPGDGDLGDGDGDVPGDGDGDVPGDGDGDVPGDGDGDAPETGGSGGQPTGTGGTGSGGTDGGTGGAPEPSCADATLDAGSVSVSTAVADDVVDLSCAPGSAPDVVFEWVAPLSDYYAFDTAGSDYDTAVSVRQDSCDGSELDCSSGADGGQYGRAVVKVERNESYYIVVSGNSGDSGNAELNVAPVACPDTDLSGQPLPATFTTLGAPDDLQVTCQVQTVTTQPEKTFRYTAEESGLYRFKASSADFRPVVDVYEGVICGGEHLGCTAGQVGLTAHPAEVTRSLEAGDSVTIVVQGEDGAGEFEFDIEKLPPASSGGCYDPPELGSGVTGTVPPEGTHELSGSCSSAGNATGSYPEHIFAFNVDLSGAGVCTVTIEADAFAFAYIVAGGDCSGPEVECISLDQNDGDHVFSFSPTDNGEYLLAIENQDPFHIYSIAYTITSSCL